jgi:hypothetical protein
MNYGGKLTRCDGAGFTPSRNQSFASKTGGFGLISHRNRQLGLGIEEMQTAGLRRQADLIAARDRRFPRARGRR